MSSIIDSQLFNLGQYVINPEMRFRINSRFRYYNHASTQNNIVTENSEAPLEINNEDDDVISDESKTPDTSAYNSDNDEIVHLNPEVDVTPELKPPTRNMAERRLRFQDLTRNAKKQRT